MTGYIKDPHTTIFTGQTGCGKTHLVLDLIEKEYKKHFDYIVVICSTLRINKTYHARDWIKMMTGFGLQILRTISISGLKNYCNCYHASKHCLSSMISSLIMTLTRGGSPYQNYSSQVGIWVIIYGCHTKEFEEAGQGYFCLVPKTKGRSQDYT